MTTSSPVLLLLQSASENSSDVSQSIVTEKPDELNSSLDYIVPTVSNEQDTSKSPTSEDPNSSKQALKPKFILVPMRSEGSEPNTNDQSSLPQYLLLPTELAQQSVLSKSVLLLANSSSQPVQKLPVPKLLPKGPYECKECPKTFTCKRNLKKHENFEHPKKEETQKNNQNTSLSNNICTTRKRNENANRISIHDITKNKTYIRCKETDCQEIFGRIAELRNHLRNVHGFNEIENYQELKFNSKAEFDQWRVTEEVTSKTNFISIVSELECLGFTFSEFGCNKGSIYQVQEQNEKSSEDTEEGTSRIGFQCTAGIRVMDFKSYLEVTYFPEHYKHEKSSSFHLPLPKLGNIIEEKLLQGAGEEEILQDLKRSMAEVEKKSVNKRTSILRRTFEKSVIENDEESVFVWVKEMLQKDNNPVLLYKRQAEELEGLKYNDFMLVLMAPIQKTMALEFDYDTVCIQTLDRIFDYDFELLSLILANSYEEGVPIAFCILSTVSEHTVSVFLNCVKKVINLKANVFIGNDQPLFYSAWEKTFSSCQQHFMCSWQVMKQWQNHLNMIKKKSKKDEIHKILKSLLYERDGNVFNDLLESFTQYNSDEDISKFYEYFMIHYYVKIDMWAYNFRKNARLDSDMHINTFNKNLIQLLLSRKPKRVDKCILKLMDLVKDKKFNDFVQLYKRTGPSPSFETQDISLFSESENIEWEIVSESGNTYRIKRDESFRDDKISPHSTSNAFCCTCSEYINSNMPCKHINFMLTFAQNSNNSIITSPDGTISIETEVPILSTNENSILTPLQTQLNSILTKLHSVQSLDDNIIQELAYHLIQIDGIDNFEPPIVPDVLTSSANSQSSNKANSVSKRRFFSVKDEIINQKKPRLSTEVTDEELVTAESILENIISAHDVEKFNDE